MQVEKGILLAVVVLGIVLKNTNIGPKSVNARNRREGHIASAASLCKMEAKGGKEKEKIDGFFLDVAKVFFADVPLPINIVIILSVEAVDKNFYAGVGMEIFLGDGN